jgi:glycosyltransferase involved in cell wall biosynthesis
VTPVGSGGLALVIPSARREGGGDIWLAELLRHLGPDHAPLAVFEHDGELAAAAGDYGCAVEILPRPDGPGEDPLALAPALAAVLGRRSPEVTVFWSPRAQLYGSPAHRLAGQPGRTAWVQHVIPSRFWLHRKASMLPTDAVLCVSGAVRREQERLYPRWPVRVVHPGVDLAGGVLTRDAARAELGLDGPMPTVGVVGRVEPWKGQDVAVRMAALLRDRQVPVRLILLGQATSATWPEFGAEVRALVAELGLTERVDFVGHVVDVHRLLPALDVLMCASREEGFGVAVVEAMAAGVPVVATRCGGPEDVVEHGVSGLLVGSDDPEGLADAVELVVNRPDLAAWMAQRAHRAWSARFTGQRSAQRFWDAVTGLTATTRATT